MIDRGGGEWGSLRGRARQGTLERSWRDGHLTRQRVTPFRQQRPEQANKGQSRGKQAGDRASSARSVRSGAMHVFVLLGWAERKELNGSGGRLAMRVSLVGVDAARVGCERVTPDRQVAAGIELSRANRET